MQELSSALFKNSAISRGVSAEDLRAVAERVREREAAGDIPPLQEAALPSAVIEAADAPARGGIAGRRAHEGFGATELTLSNGMRARWAPLRLSVTRFQGLPESGQLLPN